MRSRIKGRGATTSANVGLVSSMKIADRIHLLVQKMFNQLGRTVFRPPSPPRSMIQSSRRTKNRPTCLLFGIHREELYPDYFFCSNCKLYEDTINCGPAHGLLKRNSNRYKCMASHAFFFSNATKVFRLGESSVRRGSLNCVRSLM
jgi:hypothetical protein